MQSVKPPVEAPISRQTLSRTSICQCSSARSSFNPPRLTYLRSSPSKRMALAAETCAPALSTFCSSTITFPARIKACALSRDAARPRSTRTLSSRDFKSSSQFSVITSQCASSRKFRAQFLAQPSVQTAERFVAAIICEGSLPVFHTIFHEGVENLWLEKCVDRRNCRTKAAPFLSGFRKSRAPKLSLFLSLSCDFFQQFLVDVEVCVHVLHIVMLLEGFHQANHRVCSRSLEFDVVLRNVGHTRRSWCDARLLDGFEHAFVSGRLGRDFPVIAVVVEILSARLKNNVHQVVLFCSALGNDDVTLLVDHPGNGPGFSHVAAVFAEHVADFADGAVAIVGVDVQQNSDASRAVALERELFVGGAGQFAGAALDRPLDVVGGHVCRLGGGNRRTQARVALRITAIFGSNGYFLDETGENLAALGIERALLVLNCGPFGMAGHGSTSCSVNLDGAGFAFRGDHRFASASVPRYTSRRTLIIARTLVAPTWAYSVIWAKNHAIEARLDSISRHS